MPNIGDIARGSDIGKTGVGSSKARFIWMLCPDCGNPRWAELTSFRHNKRLRCESCRRKAISRAHWGDHNPQWTGGRRKNGKYVEVRMPPNHEFGIMRNKGGYVFEHRLIMAQQLGRPLLKQEMVHHVNGVRDDNRLANLVLVPDANSHGQYAGCVHCSLRQEIRLLRWQIKDLTETLQHKLRMEERL